MQRVWSVNQASVEMLCGASRVVTYSQDVDLLGLFVHRVKHEIGRPGHDQNANAGMLRGPRAVWELLQSVEGPPYSCFDPIGRRTIVRFDIGIDVIELLQRRSGVAYFHTPCRENTAATS